MMRMKKMYRQRMSLYTARAMLPRRQQTLSAREIIHYSWWPPPVFLLFISVLELLIFAYQRQVCGWSVCVFDRAFILVFDYPLEIWRFITYIFVHLR